MKNLFAILFVLSISTASGQEIDSIPPFDDETLVKIDESASFPGGIKAFYEYLSKNLKYPRDAQRYGIEGRVFIQFIVEKDGTISNAKVIKGIGAGCDEEALRVLREMPNWIPGKHKGEPARQKIIQNILFKFANPKEDRKTRKKEKKKKGN